MIDWVFIGLNAELDTFYDEWEIVRWQNLLLLTN